MQLFGSKPTITTDVIERKVDHITQLLAQSDLSGEEIHALREYINTSLQNLEAYRNYITEHPPVSEKESQLLEQELEMVISQLTKKGWSSDRRFPNPIRMIISVLIITLGFAMIILPAPPYFEMYTIFYFSANDGFTLMDLISLITVFCGIFTLVMTVQKHNRYE